ncbi:hypothetical protein [Cesiribacter sp. SM1]|uniref:hypothetical protein n=1 Tax=Cesiribacter sp. SM1 TaxID=2861196 RepID=UPI001CD4423E|nr:hypothetical protein [Cesiribacter sp. SM1]
MNNKFPYEMDWDGARGNVKQKLYLLTHADTRLTLIKQEPAKDLLRPKIGKTKEELEILIAELLNARTRLNLSGYSLKNKAI